MKQIILLLILAVVFFSPPVYAESSLAAHLHGHVQLNVAADGKTLFVEVHSPSESFLGFEHRPETDQQKSLWTSIKKQWENKTQELIQIDPSLSCEIKNAHMVMHFEGEGGHHHDDDHHHEETSKAHGEDLHHENEQHSHEEYPNHVEQKTLMGVHSEIQADAKFLCREEIKDSQLVVWLKKHFQNIEEIEVQVLPNSGTPYSKTLTRDKAILDL
ncbi:MAG: DUF2796 domain-containing protein [Candidatus Nitronauta litoralis]|uniref:DUF2796 domain-containing protein n=1 Tax=Candidatus Nitronauta litoralis TaxID=2705533 RepID=A0A7T0G153_9BACT|nr:MAG: DUF2796 domain-containing protein [Candidatus Nitronauta litoralis]